MNYCDIQAKRGSKLKAALKRLSTPRSVLLRSHSQTHVVVCPQARLLAQVQVLDLVQVLALVLALAQAALASR